MARLQTLVCPYLLSALYSPRCLLRSHTKQHHLYVDLLCQYITVLNGQSDTDIREVKRGKNSSTSLSITQNAECHKKEKKGDLCENGNCERLKGRKANMKHLREGRSHAISKKYRKKTKRSGQVVMAVKMPYNLWTGSICVFLKWVQKVFLWGTKRWIFVQILRDT